jgi:hypothetical protein
MNSKNQLEAVCKEKIKYMYLNNKSGCVEQMLRKKGSS